MSEGDSQRPRALPVPGYVFHCSWWVQVAEIARGQHPASTAQEIALPPNASACAWYLTSFPGKALRALKLLKKETIYNLELCSFIT